MLLATTLFLSSCGGSEESAPTGWTGPAESFRVDLQKNLDPFSKLGHGYTQWGWGLVKKGGHQIGDAAVDCKELKPETKSKPSQWFCRAVLHLPAGSVVALDVTPNPTESGRLRLTAGTGRYKNPDGWLDFEYKTFESHYTWQLCHRLTQFPLGKFCK
jgi:hypothetical protein